MVTLTVVAILNVVKETREKRTDKGDLLVDKSDGSMRGKESHLRKRQVLRTETRLPDFNNHLGDRTSRMARGQDPKANQAASKVSRSSWQSVV